MSLYRRKPRDRASRFYCSLAGQVLRSRLAAPRHCDTDRRLPCAHALVLYSFLISLSSKLLLILVLNCLTIFPFCAINVFLFRFLFFGFCILSVF